MFENSKNQTTIEALCQKLHCSEMAKNLERVNHARDLLAQLQQNKILRKLHSDTKQKNSLHSAWQKVSELLLETQQRLSTVALDISGSKGIESEESALVAEDLDLPQEEYEMGSSFEGDEVSDDAWLGFFHGYDILKEDRTCTLKAHKQCIELSLEDDCCSLEDYLRAGIRCFMLDLFLGTELEKQKLILHLRESELKLSKEYGFSFHTTLLALLSPRLQFTGAMKAGNVQAKLEKENILTLTTKRQYSTCCSCSKVYVNARFLLEDCRKGDFILIGPAIQLAIVEVLKEELKCVVVEPGLLSSRLPVRFSAYCSRSRVSLEELEDITFAREVGIKVLVSYMPGSPQYLKELSSTFDLLKYDNLRLYTRLVLNEYENEDINEIEWIANDYEGFLVEISCQKFKKYCKTTEEEGTLSGSKILALSATCWNLMTKLFNQQKPIILNPYAIADRKLYVLPHNIPHIFQFPDKFLFSKANFKNSFSFFLLQNAFIENISQIELTSPAYCQTAETGDDQLAWASVATSIQSHIQAVVVCSACPATAIKLSHFRPPVPVLLVSPAHSFDDYISVYHHVIFIPFPIRNDCNHNKYVTDACMISLAYLRSKKLLCDGQSVLLVYATTAATQFCDNHLIYKFDENHLALNLEDILFA